ncbi:hypothetical protein R1sor_014660 [Riccia sorocarpa]|uniref:Uncharacterized protein n=1 Tax=Riccia sorocarpa TaxID=122646 RepID=A0ABD3HBW5_9MARC
MRREGKIRGSFVRIRKREEFDYKLGNSTGGKPTNHSKLSGKCKCPVNNAKHCFDCYAGWPYWKALCKTRRMHKLDNRDITRNYKLENFSLKCSPSRQGPGSCTQATRYSYDYDYDEQDTPDQTHSRHSPETTITLASFLRGKHVAHKISANAGPSTSGLDEETQIRSEGLENPEKIPDGSNRLTDIDEEADYSWFVLDSSESDQGSVDLDGCGRKSVVSRGIAMCPKCYLITALGTFSSTGEEIVDCFARCCRPPADPVLPRDIPSHSALVAAVDQGTNFLPIQQDQKSQEGSSADQDQNRKRSRDQSAHSSFKEDVENQLPQPMNELYSTLQQPRRIIQLVRSKAHRAQLADIARRTEDFQISAIPEENLGLVVFKRRLEESLQETSSTEVSQRSQNPVP